VTGAARAGRPIRVLFVCTGNSARSIMAESLLRKHGGSDFEVYSAGTEPRGINPLTIRTLEDAGLPTKGLSSKSVKEFLGQKFDYVITVCDNARESCPVFPGSHQGFHWGYDDPAEATGSHDERMAVFRAVFTQISLRINEFLVVARRVNGEAPVTIR
jgi:arsenate reductase